MEKSKITFQNINGCVNIKCKDCGFEEQLFPAFIHGPMGALIGRQ